MIGKTISHYKILEKLGGGGMGVVYKAQDLKLDRFVALKFLPPYLGQAEEEKKRFIHEAKAASALDHNNICTIYEIDETEDGQMFIAMAYYKGETLKKKIERGPLPIDEAIEFAQQVAQGLAKAHNQQIVHRDIKPANIMVTDDNVVKIVDFGLAKLSGMTKLTKEGTTLGTVAYMSPEQVGGEEVDHRADIWALGVILYEMLAGEHPFKGDYEQAVIYSILNEDPVSVVRLAGEIPAILERSVHKMLAKRTEERYQHMEEVLSDLKAIEHEIGAEKKPSVQPSRSRNIPLYATVGVAFLLVFVLVIGLLLWLDSKTDATFDSIAVLPLDNLSGDPEQEYFADGMTEALIAELAQISALRVISRTSVMQYKEKKKPMSEIARELNVDAVVEGSVLHSGERVRVTAQLINARLDQHLWAKSYERDVRDVLVLQKEVARAVADEIKVKLTAQEEAKLSRGRSVNPKAHKAYLKGSYHLQKYTEEGMKKAIEYFQQAIELDSEFAPAYAGLTDAYSAMRSIYLPPHEVMPKAMAAAIKAVELDETLAEAHVAVGAVKLYYEFDWTGAEKAFKRAIKLNPNLARVHYLYASCLSVMQRHEEAIEEITRALELDPLSPLIQADAAWIYYLARQYEQAVEQGLKAIELEPNFWLAHTLLGLAYEKTGRFAQAIAALEKARQLDDSSTILEMLAGAYAVAGQINKAKEVLNELTESSKHRYVCPYEVATVYAGLEEVEPALRWLEKAYNERADCLPWLAADPKLDPVRTHPHFQDLLNRLGFPETNPGLSEKK